MNRDHGNSQDGDGGTGQAILLAPTTVLYLI